MSIKGTHICQRQMCFGALEGANSHICHRQMCFKALEGAYAYICRDKCVKEHWKVRTHTFAKGK